MHNQDQRPKVGVGVMICKEGKYLLGKRNGKHAPGEYAPPGGHLEYLESVEECARREVMEETGIEIQNVRLLCLSNQKEYVPKHYINIGILADWKTGEPKVMEAEKSEEWQWYDLDSFPKPLFATVKYYIQALKTGKNFFDS